MIKKKVLILMSLLLMTLSSFAQDHSTKPAVVCGPYLQEVTTTGFTVMWVSDIDAQAWVEIAPNDETSFYYDERPKYYDLSGNGIKPVNKIHKVRVDGLKPGTEYRYRIMMKSIAQYYGQLDIVYGRVYGANVYGVKPPVAKTLSEDYKQVKFSIVNDIHAQDSILRKLFSNKEAVKAEDFVIFNGDMTSDISNESKIVKHYLIPASELFAAETPFYMTRGNHEYRGADAISFDKYFSFPNNRTYYTFNYGKFFFVVLDSGEDKPDSDIEYQDVLCTEAHLRTEAEWLKGVVASDEFKNAERRIVISHIPPQTEDAWRGNYNMAKYFLPILNGTGIDVMFSGHNHKYSFRKAGEDGTDFPVVVNANLERLDAVLSADKFTIDIFNAAGTKTHSLNL